jgi:superfamily II DNA or RNA helicase
MSIKQADLLPDVQLQPHQQKIHSIAKEGPVRLMLMHALGSGKTLTGLSVAEAAKQPYTAIVPASLRPNLEKEREKFTDLHTPGQVMSYTAMAKGDPVKNLGTLIFDEAHRLRNPRSKQTATAQDLANRARNLVLLTGTPIVNEPGDIAPLVSMLRKQEITPEEFAGKFVEERKVNPGLVGRLRGITPGVERNIANENELRSLLKGHIDYYSPNQSAVPTQFENHEVEMSPEQTRLYQAMFDKLPWVVRWKLKHDYPLSREEFLRMQSFMVGPRQVGLSTYPFLRRKNPDRAFRESTKLQLAMQKLQERLKDPRTKALVFSNFIDAGLTPYSTALTKAGIPNAVFHGGLSDIQRKRLVDDYNANKLRVALLGPSGAEGLSFKGTQLIQQLDPYWHNIRTRQQQGRGLRFDSHTDLPEDLKNVLVQRFVAKLPLGVKDKLLSRVGFNMRGNQVAADDILRSLAARKDRLNHQFLDLLKDVGSGPRRPTLSRGTQEGVTQTPDALAALEQELAQPGKPTMLRRLYETLFGTPTTGGAPPSMKAAQAMSTIPGIALPKPSPTVTLDAPPGFEAGPRKPDSKGIIGQLREIKQHSDKKNWLAKHTLLRNLMADNPFQWEILEDPNMPRTIVGVRHWPTGFQFHMPREVVPPNLYRDFRARHRPAIVLGPDKLD